MRIRNKCLSCDFNVSPLSRSVSHAGTERVLCSLLPRVQLNALSTSCRRPDVSGARDDSFLRAAHWPGSDGCYPLAAGTMRAAVLAELVGRVLAWGLVGGQGLRAGSVDSASHEHLLEVALSVLQRCVLRVSFLQLLCGKAIGSAQCCFDPSSPSESLPPPAERRFHI